MPKLEAGSTSTSFTLDGLEYQKGAYAPIYRTIKNTSEVVVEDQTEVGLKNTYTNEMLQSPVIFSDWTDTSDSAYADLDALMSAFSTLVF